MIFLVLIVLGGVAAYVMKPDERLRVARATLRPIEDLWFAYQDERARPDPFRDALLARTGPPIATSVMIAATLAIYVASPYTHPGFFVTLIAVMGLVQPALLVERMLGHTAAGVLFFSGAGVGSVIEFARQPLVPTLNPVGGVLAVCGALLAIVVRGALRPSPMTVPRRMLRRLAPAVALFGITTIATGTLLRASGGVPLALGFVFGIVLARHMSEARAPINRVAVVALATMVIVAAVGVPVRGIVDARPTLAQLAAVEDRTAGDYAAALVQFKLGAMKRDAVAQIIDRRIDPELERIQSQLSTLQRVPEDQQALVAVAGEYVTLRRASWRLRARGLRASSMRLLRDADEKERAALAAFDRLRPDPAPH